MVQVVDAGALSVKTVNNARTWLAVVFNEAVQRRLMPATRARQCRDSRTWRPNSTTSHIDAIDPYLNACAVH